MLLYNKETQSGLACLRGIAGIINNETLSTCRILSGVIALTYVDPRRPLLIITRRLRLTYHSALGCRSESGSIIGAFEIYCVHFGGVTNASWHF